MIKKDIIKMIINSPIWNGTKNINVLMKYTKEEIKDIYNELEEAEQEYYNSMFTIGL